MESLFAKYVQKPNLLTRIVFTDIFWRVKLTRTTNEGDNKKHLELVKMIQTKNNENKKYRPDKNNQHDDDESYSNFLIFCQKQSFSFQQMSNTGKYIKEMAQSKNLQFLQRNSFDRGEIFSPDALEFVLKRS